MTRPKSLQPSESAIAIAFVDYIGLKYPQYKDLLIKIDNEGKTSWSLGKQKKREGKMKGASDYFFAKPMMHSFKDQPLGCAMYRWQHGLWLELKIKSGKESTHQKAFGHRMIEMGYFYKCCYGLDEAINAFEEYIK